MQGSNARRHQRHRQGYWDSSGGSVGVEIDRRSDAAIAMVADPAVQTKTAASSLAANELALIGLFGGQPMRNRGPRSSTQPNGPLYPEHSLWSSPHRVRAGVPT
jgi:hypothetical protein